MRTGIRSAVGFAFSTALLAAVVTTTDSAHATDVSVDGKGVAGGALLGGELGLFVVSATGAKDSWPYY
ncbi:MAG: hypothetical protein ACHREM_30190, partial [Polyangiales bacterium]